MHRPRAAVRLERAEQDERERLCVNGPVSLLDEELLPLEEAGEEVHEVELRRLLDLQPAGREGVREHLPEPFVRRLADEDRFAHAAGPSARPLTRRPHRAPPSKRGRRREHPAATLRRFGRFRHGGAPRRGTSAARRTECQRRVRHSDGATASAVDKNASFQDVPRATRSLDTWAAVVTIRARWQSVSSSASGEQTFSPSRRHVRREHTRRHP